MMKTSPKIHFQSQSSISRNCGVHVVNNLLGERVFTNQQFNVICKSLSSKIINPYKSIFGGDFDVTAVITALNSKNLETRWLKNTQVIVDVLQLQGLVGLLLNFKINNGILSKVLMQSGRHWKCIRKIQQAYFLLDSLEKDYTAMKDLVEVQGYLEIFKEKGGTILVVQRSTSKVEQIKQI